MDFGTIAGIILGVLLMGTAIFLGGNALIFFNFPSAVIVFGGTIASTFIRFPFKDVINTMRVAAKAFTRKIDPPEALIEEFIRLSQISRKEGILMLEKYPFTDKFLKKGIQLCVDGYDKEFIKDALEKDIKLSVERHEVGQAIFRSAGEASPAFGMIGTLIGLVAMLANLKEPSKIGPAMAVALITTLYGALLAYLIFLPIADKLKLRSIEEELNKKLIIEGIMCIQSGLNPRMLSELLSSFLPQQSRKN
jgi:chemotaxis protein MotA